MIVSAMASALVLSGASPPAGTGVTAPVSDTHAVRLMAQLRAASGGTALDRHDAFHETGTVIRDGHAGTYEMYGDMHALRTAGVHTIDGVFGAGGFDGEAAWRAGPDGKAVYNREPKVVREARSDAYFTIGGYYWPDRFPATFTFVGRRAIADRPCDVVRVTPEGGVPTDLWLDGRTHHLRRITVPAADATASADVLAERSVDGVVVGFKSHQREAGHDMVQTLATYSYVALDPGRLAPPK